jgi:hypothetical protein
LKTVIVVLPGLEVSVAGMAARTRLLLRNVVARSTPFHRMIDEDTKPVPLTVRLKEGPPATSEEGVRLERVGIGLLPIANVCRFEVPPPGRGLNTLMIAVPAALRSLAGMEAVTWLESMKVVRRSEPLHRTTELVMKFDPRTVSTKPGPPVCAEDGFMLEIEGTGFLN